MAPSSGSRSGLAARSTDRPSFSSSLTTLSRCSRTSLSTGQKSSSNQAPTFRSFKFWGTLPNSATQGGESRFIISNRSSRSCALLVMGPKTLISASFTPPLTWSRYPVVGITPKLGLCPHTPLNAAGNRIEPPMSVPISKEVKPIATAAAAPPEDPPGPRDMSHGLFVVPKMSL